MDQFIKNFLIVYFDQDDLVQQKSKAFLYSLIVVFLGSIIYGIISFLMGHLLDFYQILGVAGFCILCLFLLKTGQFSLSRYLFLGMTILGGTSLVYFGPSMIGFKIYTMALLHSVVVLMAVMISNSYLQLIFTGISSVIFMSIFAFFRLLPEGAPLEKIIVPYLVSVIVVVVEVIIALQSQRLIQKSLQKISFDSTHDPDSGLPNKVALFRKMKQSLEDPTHRHLVLIKLMNHGEIILNLDDDFAGEAIKTLAIKLEQETGSILYQLEKDALVMVLALPQEYPQQQLRDLLRPFRSPIKVEGIKLQLLLKASSAPIIPGDDPKTSLKKAMIALHDPGSSNGSILVYQPRESSAITQKLGLIHKVGEALEKKTFEFYFQPIFDRKYQISSVEVLARLNPTGPTPISPNVFIPIMEDSGLINDFFFYALSSLLEVLRSTPALSSVPRFFINISPVQFQHGFQARNIDVLLGTSGVQKDRIGLEITESTLLSEDNRITSDLERLSALNIDLALDDFGTGYSNLAGILGLPIKKLKFDKSLIRDLKVGSRNFGLLKSMIPFLKESGLETLAEGVETKEELNILRELGCESFQGYLFSKPLPKSQFIEFLSNWDPETML